MGACCNSRGGNKTSHELFVDEIFSHFPLRSLSPELIINQITENSTDSNNDKKNISKEKYEEIFQRYCKISESFSPVDIYWRDFYITKPVEFKYIFIKFQFALLSNNKKAKDEIIILGQTYKSEKTDKLEAYNKTIKLYIKILQEYKNYFNNTKKAYPDHEKTSDDSKNCDNKFNNKISIEMLYPLIYNYIFSITTLTIEYLKHLQNDSPAFKKVLYEKWSVQILEGYINYIFFEDELDPNVEVDINSFIEKHFERLTDDAYIRSELNEFYYRFQDLQDVAKIKIINSIDYDNIFNKGK